VVSKLEAPVVEIVELRGVNQRLLDIEGLVNQPLSVLTAGAGEWQVGVDLGTADIQTIAVAADGQPIAAMLTWADVVRDGVVVDYARACAIVREQLSGIEACLGQPVTEVVTSFPPGTDARLSTHVVESAGVRVKYVIDEPSSVAALLGIRDGAVVDIGGGTTGTAIVKNGEIIASRDDATGGRHLDLALAGHLGIELEQAELHKRECSDNSVADILRPVIQKMADVVRGHIEGFAVPQIYLSGGSCALPGFRDAFAAEFPEREVVLPQQPLYLTPLAIASFCLNAAPALNVAR
jgi:ethanolamine utilization protein EutJ